MIHEMTLNTDPFNRIKDGTKTIELRLFDSKRKSIQVGDQINFKNTTTDEMLSVKVKGLAVFPTFVDLVNNLDIRYFGASDKNMVLQGVHSIYSQEQIFKNNIIGIFIELIQ